MGQLAGHSDNVTMFPGHKIVAYCNMAIFVVIDSVVVVGTQANRSLSTSRYRALLVDLKVRVPTPKPFFVICLSLKR